MSNNRIPLVFYVLLSAFLLNGATAAFSQFVEEKHPEDTQESAFSSVTEEAPAAPAPVFGKAITVTDVVVDKTDKNAVVARDGAIVEAQKKAFQVVAEKSMSAEAFKTYKLPDAKTIAMLVDNFEIKNEQLSSTRYVASFTVRFLSEINNYLNIPSDIGKTISAGPPAAVASTPEATPSATPAATAPATARTVLVLPYYEGAAGRKLWEDPNPWRDAWQETGNSASAPGLTVSVPTGDLADVSLGDTEAAWQGNYAVIEKARANYNANEVALVVAQVPVTKAFGLAGKTGAEGVDLYLFKDGKLERLKFIEGKLGSKDSYKQAIAKVVEGLKTPVPFDEPAPPDAAVPSPPPEKTAASSEAEKQEGEQEAAGGSVVIDVSMSFADYAQWMEAQRRISEILPPVDIEISRLTKGQAQFRMDYTGGDLAAFRTVLAGKGLELERPVVEVDESVLGNAKPTQKTVYELRLQN